MEYKARNHPSPTVSIQDNDLGFSPIQCACKDGWIILCWLKVVCDYKIYFLWDWTSVNVGSSLAAPIRSLFRTQPWLTWSEVMLYAMLKPKRRDLPPFHLQSGPFFLFLALNAPSLLPPHAWNTQTIKPIADSVNLPCYCGTKVWVVRVLFEDSSQRLRKSEFIG